LINVAVETLLRNRCELPGFPTLDRVVRRVRALVHRKFFQRVLARISESEMQSVDRLLSTETSGKTAFNEVKRLPKRPTLEHFEMLLNHLEWLDSLGPVDQFIADIPPAMVRHFAREAKALDAAELKYFTAPKRYTLLICLIQRMRVQARDDLAEMFLKRMGKIHKNAQEALQDLQARQRRMTEALVATLDGVLRAVTAAGGVQDTLNDIRDLFAAHGGTQKLRDDCAAIAAWSNENYYPLLLAPYRSHRPLLFRLVRSLHLESTTVETSLLEALAIIIEGEHKRGEWIAEKDIDLSFATERWQALVRVKQSDNSRIHRRYFEICVFSHLASDIKSGDVSVTGSEAFADYRQQLMPWSECKTLVPSYCERLGLPATAHEFVAEFRGKLERTAQRVDDGYPNSNGEVVINDQGEPTLKRVVARDIPQSALELEAAILQKMPTRSLLDILCDVEHWTEFTRHFGPLSGSDPKLERAVERYLLTIFVLGTNLGVNQGARHMRRAVTAHMLSFVNRRHVTAEKIEAAMRDIIDCYHQFALPRVWGDGKSAAADGTQYHLYEQNLVADYHIRYGSFGAIAYHHVSDNYIALFSHFIPPGVWEAIYIIEGLLKNTSVIQPDRIHADTQGQSTPVFAFSYRLGIQLMPRIRNWKDLTFYRFDKSASYRHIDSLFSETVNWKLIEDLWQDLMQVASLRSSTAEENAPSFYGDYISDLPLRRQITATTNKAEAYNSFAKWLFFGGEGVITENDRDEQEKRIKYNDLVANAAILQNVIDIGHILRELEGEGRAVPQEDLAYLSPYLTRSIKRFGDYTINLGRSPAPLDEEVVFPVRKGPARATQTVLPFVRRASA
jgi:TnpA family transposase